MEKLKIELTTEDVNLVLSALVELPFRISNDIINNITLQAQSQLQPIAGTPNVETTVIPEVAK